MTAAPEWLTEDVVTAVLRHMNADHTDDSLLIVRALGGVAAATSAQMTGLDLRSAFFSADAPDGTVSVTVPWSTELIGRAQIRAEVVTMYEKSCAALGVEPRAH